MTTKAYHVFKMKLNNFDDDIDLIDILISAVERGDLTDAKSPYILKPLDPSRHTHLSRRSNSDNSRSLIIHHLKQTLYSAYIKDIYEELAEYLKTITKISLKNSENPLKIIGKHKIVINAKDMINLGIWDAVCRMVANNIFQHLEEERSTSELLKNK